MVVIFGSPYVSVIDRHVVMPVTVDGISRRRLSPTLKVIVDRLDTRTVFLVSASLCIEPASCVHRDITRNTCDDFPRVNK